MMRSTRVSWLPGPCAHTQGKGHGGPTFAHTTAEFLCRQRVPGHGKIGTDIVSPPSWLLNLSVTWTSRFHTQEGGKGMLPTRIQLDLLHWTTQRPVLCMPNCNHRPLDPVSVVNALSNILQPERVVWSQPTLACTDWCSKHCEAKSQLAKPQIGMAPIAIIDIIHKSYYSTTCWLVTYCIIIISFDSTLKTCQW